ncbi:predicted protein [Nematostella vectensis]|uniref:Superoxide dismutase n=1 Tax=Nematostella vectensis TaxID=45351 RepID=A7RUV6_NEMVE|nr:predicted protein [Nematostella vectensis]|eukprot:XP_001636879.1 predicted protein [Nematostella vectensis]
MEKYTLPELPYDYNELEPHIDEATLRVHHLGHHAAYTKKLNAALKDIVEILRNNEQIPDKWRTDVINNGGGFVNHALYWATMSPNPKSEPRTPTGKIGDLIDKSHGNFSMFKQWFDEQVNSMFGSGYTWLCQDVTSGFLTILNMGNQESPVAYRLNPVLVIDLWEHAFYLKHQNKRPGYVHSWWHLVDWERVNELLEWWQNQNIHDEL